MASETKAQGWRSLIDPINDNIVGTKYRDTLITRGEGDIIFGLGSSDSLSSAYNRTALVGGKGNDTLTTDVTLPLLGTGPVRGVAVQFGGSGHDTLDATVTLQGGGAVVQSTEFRAKIFLSGGSGDDTISAVAKVSQPIAGSVTATTHVLGGAGDDVIDVIADTRHTGDINIAKNTVDGGTGDDHITARAETELGGSFAKAINVISGGRGNDVIEAKARGVSGSTELVSNSLEGGRGDDVLRAFNWSDSNSRAPVGINELWGGSGDDVLEAAHFTDGENTVTAVTSHLYGGNGDDRLTAASTASGEYVSAMNRLKGDDGEDFLSARLEADSHAVRSLDRDMYDVANVLNGGAKDDHLDAFLSVVVLPHAPDDSKAENRLYGGSGNDVLVATVAAGSVGTSFLYGGWGTDELTVVGGTGNVLDGGQGRDRLTSGVGDDHMIGGSGADLFVFAPKNGHDTLAFEQGTDKIDLAACAASDIHEFADLEIEVVSGNSVVRFDAENDITVAGVTSLRADDFLFA